MDEKKIITEQFITEQLIDMIINPKKDTCDPGVWHDPKETMQRNALFLLNSSKKIDSYDESILTKMNNEYGNQNYKEVIELAFIHDRQKREMKPIKKLTSFLSNILSILTGKKKTPKI